MLFEELRMVEDRQVEKFREFHCELKDCNLTQKGLCYTFNHAKISLVLLDKSKINKTLLPSSGR